MLRAGLLALVLAAAGVAHGQSGSNNVSSSGSDNSLGSSSSSGADPAEPRQLRQPSDTTPQKQDTGAKRTLRGADSDTKRDMERMERTMVPTQRVRDLCEQAGLPDDGIPQG